MKLAIADPPYLGRAHRWYGGGRGSGGGRHHAPSIHPAASEWDHPERHAALVAELDTNFDGWAIAASADSLAVYLAAWTLWVLDVLGYDPQLDTVTDLFPGSYAVSDAAAVLL